MMDLRKLTRSLWYTKVFRMAIFASAFVLLLHGIGGRGGGGSISEVSSFASDNSSPFVRFEENEVQKPILSEEVKTEKTKTKKKKKPLTYNEALRKLNEFNSNMPGSEERSSDPDSRNSIPVQVIKKKMFNNSVSRSKREIWKVSLAWI